VQENEHTSVEARNLRHITIDDLSVGMFVEDVFDRNGVFLLSAGQLIEEQRQIDQLRSRQVQSVFVNEQKGTIDATPGASPHADPAEREKAYHKELERAKSIQTQTLETVRETLTSLRMGKSFSSDAVKNAAGEIVSSILRNPDALISLIQIKGYDEYTYTHSVNVGIIATSLAHFMGYDGDDLMHIGMGGVLHDIGKMRVPDEILNKPGKLTDSEFNIMKKHPEHGLEMVRGKKNMNEIVYRIIGQHHERFNGSGYPGGLRAGGIHEIGVISAVADVYDALTSDRVYREAWTPQRALATIFQGADKDFAHSIVELFTKHLGIYPVGSFVRLSGGEMGVVTRIDRGNLLAPVVLVLFDQAGRRLTTPVEVDLTQKQSGKSAVKYRIVISLDPKLYRINVGDYLKGTV
jgi:putative nucleotidyltransferase with HDIG domain